MDMGEHNQIDSPLSHGRVLHGAGVSSDGLVSLAQKVRGEWKENVYTVEELLEILPAYYGATDVYVSQNRFRRWRGVNRLAEISSMYADLDFYHHPDLSEMHVAGVLRVAMDELEKARLPRPSYAMSTGRGLALVWLHEPVPPAELPRWDLCQAQLWRALRDVGADRAATDAARVLRLAGTLNSKSGSLVRTLWEDIEHVWGFGDLVGEILPPDLRNLKAVPDERPRSAAKNSRHASNMKPGLTVRSLNEARLRDLRKLMSLRNQKKLPPGGRDAWMLIAASCLSRLVSPERLEGAVYKLAEEVAGWSTGETKSRMQQIFVRSNAAAKDEKVVWMGLPKDPRYQFTNTRIIEMLGITPEEERNLETIISTQTKRQRDKERSEKQRRAVGSKSRSEYLAGVEEKKRLVVRLHKRGYSNARIAQQTGYSLRHVSRIIASRE